MYLRENRGPTTCRRRAASVPPEQTRPAAACSIPVIFPLILYSTFAGSRKAHTQSGGPYAYTRTAFGNLPGFLVGWGYWISVWSGVAAVAIVFVGYLGVFVPAVAG
ncbi:MAG: amino acid permease, partial [Gammaproteobacteria bacterium]|nr:amino acid permease [Gammaproteobacteria bacterium]